MLKGRNLLPTRALQTRPLALFSLLFGLGALCAADGRLALLPLCVCGFGLIAAYALLRLGGRRFGALVAASAVFLGAAHMTRAVERQPVIEDRHDVEISGVVKGSVYVDAQIDRLTCRLTDVELDDEAFGYDLRLYLRGDESSLRKVLPGQRVCAFGHLWAAEKAGNPGEFDFSAYLWRNGIAAYCTADLADARITGSAGGLGARVHAIRQSVGARIDQLFPRSAQLVRALVLGDRADMDEDVRQSFNRAGVAHVLAISGLHITMLAMAVMTLLGLFLPRRWAYVFALLLIGCYGVLIGMSASALRAILMYAALGAGRATGRPTDALTRLALAFLALLVWNPLWIQDAGFVLSFSASVGMMLLTPAISRVLRLNHAGAAQFSLRPRALLARAGRYFGSVLCATLAAQLATLPAVIAYYGEVPLFATLANLVVVPLILASLLLSVAALALSVLWLPLGLAVAWLSDLALLACSQLTSLCASLPFNALALPALSWWITALYTCAMVAASDYCRFKSGVRAAMLLALPALVCVWVLLARPHGLEIVFLDAGQADAAVVTAQEQVYLIDVGLESTPVDDYLSYVSRKPKAVFLSHPHDDHAGGLNELLDYFVPETIYVPAGWDDVEQDTLVREGMERAVSLGVEVVALAAGDEVRLSEDVRASVLHPARGAQAADADPNDISMLLLIEYGQSSALFTGDLPISSEPGPMPDVDVLKIAHHGSAAASSLMMLHSASPSAAVISVGAGNSYGHPHEDVLRRLRGCEAELYRTDLNGAVTVRLYESGEISVYPYRTEEEPT